MKLWTYTMPRLTGSIFLEEAGAMNLFIHGQMVNLSTQQWAELEDRCRVRLGWPVDWKEKRWHKCKQQVDSLGWGTSYGPETLGNYTALSPTCKRSAKYRQKKSRGKRKPQVQEEKLF